jgi:hypothetical protein
MRRLAAALLGSVWASDGYALLTPLPGSLGYDIYDVFVTRILQGPIGYVGGLFCIVFGFRQLIHYNYAPAGPPHFGLSTWVPISCLVWWLMAAMILNSEHMLNSLGALV